MIYRILASSKVGVWDEVNKHWVYIPNGKLKGAFYADVEGFALLAPDIKNTRARFYFTEKGWQTLGKQIVVNGRNAGHVVRVIRRKNPLKSQIVYQDELQVAILPRKPVRHPKP